MRASKVSLFQLLVVACLVGSSVMSTTQSAADEQPQCDESPLRCQVCKDLAHAARQGVADAVKQLKVLCHRCGSRRNQSKCRQLIDVFAADVRSLSAHELCELAGFCRRHAPLNPIGL